MNFGNMTSSVGSLPKRGGNKFILVVIDHFSKWVEAAVLENRDEETVARHLEHWMLKNGIPSRIFSDNGKEFDNDLCRKLAGDKKLYLGILFSKPP